MNSVLDGLRERRLEDIQLAMLEKREARLLAVDLKASEERKICTVVCRLVSIDVVIVSARE
jgi:hypothetical protein